MTNLSWLIYQGKIFPQKENKYTLSENDIIKIGKIILKIREIKIKKKKIMNQLVIMYQKKI